MNRLRVREDRKPAQKYFDLKDGTGLHRGALLVTDPSSTNRTKLGAKWQMPFPCSALLPEAWLWPWLCPWLASLWDEFLHPQDLVVAFITFFPYLCKAGLPLPDFFPSREDNKAYHVGLWLKSVRQRLNSQWLDLEPGLLYPRLIGTLRTGQMSLVQVFKWELRSRRGMTMCGLGPCCSRVWSPAQHWGPCQDTC